MAFLAKTQKGGKISILRIHVTNLTKFSQATNHFKVEKIETYYYIRNVVVDTLRQKNKERLLKFYIQTIWAKLAKENYLLLIVVWVL